MHSACFVSMCPVLLLWASQRASVCAAMPQRPPRQEQVCIHVLCCQAAVVNVTLGMCCFMFKVILQSWQAAMLALAKADFILLITLSHTNSPHSRVVEMLAKNTGVLQELQAPLSAAAAADASRVYELEDSAEDAAAAAARRDAADASSSHGATGASSSHGAADKPHSQQSMYAYERAYWACYDTVKAARTWLQRASVGAVERPIR